jgi:hypothetical protein
VRLLDLIGHGRSAPLRSNDGHVLPGAEGFRNAICKCPLRYVLSADLVSCATQLAYAEGDRVAGCLDLIHVPAQDVWIEWPEQPRLATLREIPSLEVNTGRVNAKWAGSLVRATPHCRSGTIRTFWSTSEELAYLSPMITSFNLDESMRKCRTTDPTIWRGDAVLQLKEEPAIDELLEYFRFQLDDEWAKYYHERAQDSALREAILRACLRHCAFDPPMLMAFALLLGARDLLPRQTINRDRLNRARNSAGRPPLLEHIEVSAPINILRAPDHGQANDARRLSPRLHHVRGHIVRRGSAVFWRSPHLRGNARIGRVRSRTVILKFATRNAKLSDACH